MFFLHTFISMCWRCYRLSRAIGCVKKYIHSDLCLYLLTSKWPAAPFRHQITTTVTALLYKVHRNKTPPRAVNQVHEWDMRVKSQM